MLCEIRQAVAVASTVQLLRSRTVRMIPASISELQIVFSVAIASRVARLTGRPRGSASTRSARIHGNSAADSAPAATSGEFENGSKA